MPKTKSGVIFFIVAVVLCGIAASVFLMRNPFSGQSVGSTPFAEGNRAAPVEVMPVEHGPIELRRTFSGTLEPRVEFVVAPKVAGRVERLMVNIADPVKRGQLVAELDSEEYVQAVAQAKADLAVARANLVEAGNALEIARRGLNRIETLRQRGVASESQLDTVKAEELAKESALEVAEAQVVRAESALETARIRLGYTQITAGWSGGSDRRVVAERFVDEGETVSANAPLLRIVELDPITGVIFVTERDYARLQPGQDILLATDAYPGEKFPGRIERIAPIFREATRQARVELTVANPERRLKPGMFIRTTVVLTRKVDAIILPATALVKREGRTGVFQVSAGGESVHWREVTTGIRDGDRVEILDGDPAGRVVTLGQQLLADDSLITIPAEPAGLQDNGEAGPR